MHLSKFQPGLASVLFGSMLVLGPLSCAEHMAKHKPSEAPSATPSYSFQTSPAFTKSTGNHELSIAQVTEQVMPSVVTVSATKVLKVDTQNPFSSDPFFRRFWGPGLDMPQQREEHGLGSGVIVSNDGLVLTNHHVIDGAQDIKVQASDGREFKAKVVGSDSKSDLAVLRLEGDAKGLHPLQLGDSSRLRLGDVVLAIGNPFGIGQTVTMGIVSAKGRADMGITDYEDFIQTDAAINPGNSGGALVDLEGHLVGINTAILSRSGGYQGIGFAIPSNMAKPVMDSLVKNGKVVRGWLGIGIQDLTPELAKSLDLEGTQGVLVSEVQAGSPAERGGLERGDVVLSVNGNLTTSAGHLRNLVAEAGAAAKVRLEIMRNGRKKQSKDITLGELPEERVVDAAADGALGGLTLESLTPENRSKYKLSDSVKSGVVVTHVQSGTLAGRTLNEGDVIVEVNRKPLKNPGDLEHAYRQSTGPLLLLVQRGDHTLFLPLPRK